MRFCAPWRMEKRRLARERNHQIPQHRVGTVPPIVAILKLPHILRKMLRADMDMRSVNPALQLRPEAFKAVHRYPARNIFARTVVYAVMPIAVDLPQIVIAGKVVAVDFSVRPDMLENQPFKRWLAAVGDHRRDKLAATLQHAKYGSLVASVSRFFALALAANPRFINLDRAHETANRAVTIDLRRIFTNFMAHAPRGFVRHAQLAFDFLGCHAVPRSAEQEHDMEPVAQRSAGALERSVGHRRNLVAAVFA